MSQPEERRVVVGYDGTGPAGRAVNWAADEAARRGVPLEIVHVSERPAAAGSAGGPAGTVTAEGVRHAVARHPGLPVRGRTTTGSPRAELVRAAAGAGVLVLGHRPHTGLPPAGAGSVVAAVSAQAGCPVVVVRGERLVAPGPARPVVVGVDGSTATTGALLFAADVAAAAGAPLTLVYARPATLETWARGRRRGGNRAAARVEVTDEASRVIVGRAKDVVRRHHPRLAVRAVMGEGSPAAAIVANARNAALVVVGRRGHGVPELLGSVGHSVVHGAHCPVVLVPPVRRRRRAPADLATTG
jgi:nucleotide-binding universal stress UspA family protein